MVVIPADWTKGDMEIPNNLSELSYYQALLQHIQDRTKPLSAEEGDLLRQVALDLLSLTGQTPPARSTFSTLSPDAHSGIQEGLPAFDPGGSSGTQTATFTDYLVLTSERKVQTILEGITDYYYFLDREWRFTTINALTLNYFLMERKAILGKSFWEVFPVMIGTVVDQQYRKSVGEHVPVDFILLSPVSERWEEIHAYPTEEGLIVYFHDITDRKQTEAALHESEQQYRELVAVTQRQTQELTLLDEVRTALSRELKFPSSFAR